MLLGNLGWLVGLYNLAGDAMICPSCNGTGINRRNGWDCEHCDGRGWQSVTELLTPVVTVILFCGVVFTLVDWLWHLFTKR